MITHRDHAVNSSTVKSLIITAIAFLIKSAENAVMAAETALSEMENVSCATEHDMIMRDDVLNYALDRVETARESLEDLRRIETRVKDLEGSEALGKAKREIRDVYESILTDTEEVVGMNETERDAVADDKLWRHIAA